MFFCLVNMILRHANHTLVRPKSNRLHRWKDKIVTFLKFKRSNLNFLNLKKKKKGDQIELNPNFKEKKVQFTLILFLSNKNNNFVSVDIKLTVCSIA
jgi:hypothetical protein